METRIYFIKVVIVDGTNIYIVRKWKYRGNKTLTLDNREVEIAWKYEQHTRLN